MTSAPSDIAKPKCRWYQYSLRTLLLVMLLASIGMSWFATRLQRARRQREAVEEITKRYGWVGYDYQFDASGDEIPSARPPGPASLRALLGDDFFATVTRAYVANPNRELTDLDLKPIEGLPELEELTFGLCTPVTDARLERLKRLTHLRKLDLFGAWVTGNGIEHLTNLTRLETLNLGCTDVDDAGLENLALLSRLRELDLRSTKITDAGLAHLSALTQLRVLRLCNTEVTDDGLRHLRGLTRLAELDLSQTSITDAGLDRLGEMHQLAELLLWDTRVTDAGLKHLKGLSRLELLCLHGTKVTNAGLRHLHGLNQLRELGLWDTHVTHAGVEDLRTALPHCDVLEVSPK